MATEDVFRWMAEHWAGVAARFGAYNLDVPGSPGFICKAEASTAHSSRL